ncbi:membrane protein DedA with SNARE-associated domain [Catenulispora sp. GAS73]|uniref:DedA family protein n=1 Tax=Catenulispora sp. GAS73 TaxID=3156269 RepID=UPI00351563F1
MSLHLINHLLAGYGYLVVFAFVALESVGLPLPGETALIAAGVYAGTTHHLNVGVVALVAAVAAVLGDNVGYLLGRHGGARLVARFGRRVGLTPARLKVGRYLFARHGGKVVFFGRFVTVLRTFAAFFAGLNGMRRGRFVVANAVGGVLWAGLCAFGAYALGSAATQVGTFLLVGGIAVTASALVTMAVAVKHSMRRLEERAEAAFPGPAPAQSPVTVRTEPVR